MGASSALTLAPAHAAFPGRNGRIAYVNTLFSHSEEGENQIFTVRPNGTGRRQLTYRGESYSPTIKLGWRQQTTQLALRLDRARPASESGLRLPTASPTL